MITGTAALGLAGALVAYGLYLLLGLGDPLAAMTVCVGGWMAVQSWELRQVLTFNFMQPIDNTYCTVVYLGIELTFGSVWLKILSKRMSSQALDYLLRIHTSSFTQSTTR